MITVSRPPAPTDAELKHLVERAYPYVALFNVTSGFTYNARNPFATHGWNKTYKATQLADHRVRDIAGPNNDTLYVISMLDLRAEPVVIRYPAFDSQYVSLETCGFDHYCDVPLSTRTGDFAKPLTVLYYTQRTQGYTGTPVPGVDRVIELSGDFASAFLRVRPHATEPERFARIVESIGQVDLRPLSVFLGQSAPPALPLSYPKFGRDIDTFGSNFLEVVQFVFNHTTFDPQDRLDAEALATLKKVGVEPGKAFDPAQVAEIDPARIQPVVQEVIGWAQAHRNKFMYEMFKPKGIISFESMLALSVTGPVGQPLEEAFYPILKVADGKPMQADGHYVLRMSADQLPPAQAFWSATLYDGKSFLFIPNERMKYSVGQNAGMQLEADGGIAIHVSRNQPAGVPLENWIPSGEIDQPLVLRLRVYQPDMAKVRTWPIPVIETLEGRP